jgi:iron complex outermembrane receptor protein
MDETPVTFNNQSNVKSYSVLDARLGYKKAVGDYFSLDAFVGSNNITGSTYYNFLFVGQNVGALGDGYISPAPYKPTLYGGTTVSFNF